jgi:tetratricopeptide (TPR) repeat protein
MVSLNDLVEQAYELFQKKKFDEALTALQQIDKDLANPNLDLQITQEQEDELTASVENFKGFNYLGKGDIKSAKEAFEKSLSLNPNSSQACAGLGEVYYLCNMDQEAKVLYEWALDNNPMNQLASAGLAKINKNLGLPENHNTLNITTSFKKKKSFYEFIADAYELFNENKFAEALNKLDEAEKLFSKVVISKDAAHKIASLENFKGFNFMALKDFDSAKECFENALNLNPNSSQACSGLGEIFYLNHQDEEAKSMV